MGSSLATIVCVLGILVVFWLDRPHGPRPSRALWVAVVWVFIAGSRMVSHWIFGVEIPEGASPSLYLDGSPLDRVVLSLLVGAGVAVLVVRRARVGTLLRANGPIIALFAYGALSVLWSDYPDVALKRWVKAAGNVVMVLVILTDPYPAVAIRRLLVRTGVPLIALSVLFVKYYPALGRAYNPYSWSTVYSGVTTGKNELGYICVVFGLAAAWRMLETIGERGRPGRRGRLVAHGAILAMALWLLVKADSATSLVCLAIGGVALVVLSFPEVVSRPAAVHAVLAVILFGAVFSTIVAPEAGLVEAVDRDTTLHGRTIIWDEALALLPSPWLGTGFESFWLGARAEWFWNRYWWRPNQAHNGYLEIFLNLGAVGIVLLAVMIGWGYRNVVLAARAGDVSTAIGAAYFVAVLLFNLTEAGFSGMHLMAFVFLLSIAAVPGTAAQSVEVDAVPTAAAATAGGRLHG